MLDLAALGEGLGCGLSVGKSAVGMSVRGKGEGVSIGEAVLRHTVHCWICRCHEANDPVMVSKTILIVNTNIQQSFEIIMCWYHSRVDGTILADGI